MDNGIRGDVKAMKHVAKLVYRDQEAIQPLYGRMQDERVTRSVVMEFDGIHMDPFHPNAKR